MEKDDKNPVTISPISDNVVEGDTVFKLDTLKNAVGEVRVADDAVSAPIETKGGRGHTADRGASSGRWSNRTVSGMSFEGGGRGGRGHLNEGRGRGGRGPPRSGPDAGAAAVTRTEPSKHSGYIIEKPKDEDAADKTTARSSSKTGERRVPAGASVGATKGARTKTGGSGRIFVSAAQQTNLMKSKSKVTFYYIIAYIMLFFLFLAVAVDDVIYICYS